MSRLFVERVFLQMSFWTTPKYHHKHLTLHLLKIPERIEYKEYRSPTARAGLSPRGAPCQILSLPPIFSSRFPSLFLSFFSSYNNTLFRFELDINYLFEEINCCCIVLHRPYSFQLLEVANVSAIPLK